MSVYVECADGSGFKNTGASEQCLEGLTVRTAYAPKGFSFDSIDDAKDIEKWKEAIAAKQIYPLYDVEELATANTDDTVFEGRTKQYVTQKGKKVSTYNSMIGLCSHNALKSFNRREGQLFELTDANEIKAVMTVDEKIKGQTVSLTIGKRVDAMPDRPAYTPVTINYIDYNEFEDNGAVLRPDWSVGDIEGIYDITLTIIEASATSIKFTATVGCAGGNDIIESLEVGDILLLDVSGDAQSPSGLTFYDGVYELTGTGLVSGTLDLNGVVSQTDMIMEAVKPVTVTIS